MIWDYLKAALGIAGAMVVWLAVQRGWRRTFPDDVGDGGDVLAGRTSCGACECSSPCDSRREREADAAAAGEPEPLRAGHHVFDFSSVPGQSAGDPRRP